jgi:hypothetical protein
MFKKTRKFFALDHNTRRMLIQAWRLLGAMRFAILTTSFKRLVASLTVHREAVDQFPLNAESLATAHTIGWSVRTAARFTPWNSTCLVQVLAAQRMLQQRGIAGAFYLGAATGSESEKQQTLAAHAWLKCDDDFITGEPGHERFTVVTSFSWL